MKIVVDSYAWIEVFSGSTTGEAVLATIDQAEGILVPDIVLAEVARKYLREGINERVIDRRLTTICETSEVVQIDRSLALEAAKAFLQLQKKAKKESLRKPSLFDAIMLATARANGAKLLSGDQHFTGLPQTVWPSS